MDMQFMAMIAIVLGVVYIWIGKKASEGLSTNEDYFLMGRNLTCFPFTLTLLATQLGGGTVLGAAQQAYEKGWVVLLYPLGNALGFLALSLGFGQKLQALNVSTIAEIFEKVYGSKRMRKIVSFLSIVTLFFVLSAQAIAAKAFMSSLGFDQPLLLVLLWAILVAYTVMGGFKAVVNTDVFQVLFILGVLMLVVANIDFTPLFFEPIEFNPTTEIPYSGWLLLPLLFTFIEQDMGQRCFAAKSPKIVTLGGVGAAVLLMLGSTVAIAIGILAQQQGIKVENSAEILMTAIATLTNPTLATLFMAAILLAIVSTADSLLCSISSNLSCDFIQMQGLSEPKQLQLSRLLTLIVGVATVSVAFCFQSVVSMLILSYEFSVCTMLIPVLTTVLLKNPSKVGCFLSMGVGTVGFVALQFMDLPIPKEWLNLSLSAFAYSVGSVTEYKICLLQEKIR